jgi:hypothetical protein
LQQDIPKADLLLVMGTSLQVAPVSLIPDMVNCNRVLFNRDLVMRIQRGDIFVSGDCDKSVKDLCELLGWGEDLLAAHTRASVRKEQEDEKPTADIEVETVEDEGSNEQQTVDETQISPEEEDEPQEESTGESTPSTVLIMLGSMHFEHAGTADVLSLKISSPEESLGTLEDASKRVAPNTVEALHLVMKSSSISSLFEETLLSTFFDSLKPGTGEVIVHVLPESSVLADEMPVQANDVDAIRMGLVVTGFRLEMEQEQDGSWILLAKKPGAPSFDENDDEEEAEDNSLIDKLEAAEWPSMSSLLYC